ncbi:phage portal protein [Bacillaceae bacterium Marseille-Q3522]|nr:phage portal protein [Bacillaceae bacterium Marseille-Q3522]
MPISDFLLDNVNEEEKVEVHIKRFKSPFVIKSITEAENDAIRKRCTIKVKARNGMNVPETNTSKYTGELIAASVVEPDLHNSELQEHYSTPGSAVDTLRAMLRPGEFALLSEKVQEINGYDLDVDDLKEEAKN